MPNSTKSLTNTEVKQAKPLKKEYNLADWLWSLFLCISFNYRSIEPPDVNRAFYVEVRVEKVFEFDPYPDVFFIKYGPMTGSNKGEILTANLRLSRS